MIRGSRLALDGEYVSDDAQPRDGSLISIIPPVSGGAPRVFISPDEIEIDEAMRAVASPRAGAVVLFVGTVREEARAIEYEAKVDMAERELEKLIDAAKEKFGADAFIRHCIGRVEAGGASVVIATAAPHRREAYEANAWLLDELKRIVPIWKEEERLDGTKFWAHGGG